MFNFCDCGKFRFRLKLPIITHIPCRSCKKEVRNDQEIREAIRQERIRHGAGLYAKNPTQQARNNLPHCP